MTGERHVEGHLVVVSLLEEGASPFFKVEGQEGLACAKGHRVVIGFRHARFDDFHQSTTHREIVNVERFKVSRRPIQDIGDSIAHHPTGPGIAVHEQNPLGGQFFLGTKLDIQIRKEPVATHAHLELGRIQTPFGSQLTRYRGVCGVGGSVGV